MRIGFLTNALAKEGMAGLKELAAWAAQNGFQDLEVGPTVPLAEDDFAAVLSEHNVRITALIYCRNFLSTDSEEAAQHQAELRRRIELAGRLGIEKVITSTGIDKSLEEGVYDRADAIRKIPARSLDKVAEVFLPLVELAEKRGVKLAFENCPLMGNIAISPILWEAIFRRLDSANVGLAYDPSHLIWQQIDPYTPVDRFFSRIFHIHAKDTVIDYTRLSETGILTDFSWWRYCIPGKGSLDWKRFLGLLAAKGYRGTVSLEHEDADYEGSLEKVQQGLIEGKDYINTNLS